MTVITEFAPAKINLTLEVLGRRTDGYHELRSLVAFARDAADVVVLDPSKPAGCTTDGPFGATIAGQNLIDVTLARLRAADPQLLLGHVTLTKNLPVAAGIGGGSADAAAVLRAVRRANPERAAHIDWQAIARSLGADVPVCLVAQKAMMGGIGEIISSGGSFAPLAAVLVNPLRPVPADKTAQVFRRLAAPPLAANAAPPPVVSPFFESPDGLLNYMQDRPNALQHAANSIVPEIAEVTAALSEEEGAHAARMSGGGPTCFAVFTSSARATAAAERLQAQHPSWWVAATRIV